MKLRICMPCMPVLTDFILSPYNIFYRPLHQTQFLSFIIGILSDLYLLYIFHLEIFALNENNFSNIASIWWPNFFFYSHTFQYISWYCIWLSCCVEKNEVREFLNSINVITWSENIIFFFLCCSFLLFTFYLKIDMLIAYMKKVRYKYYFYVLSILWSPSYITVNDFVIIFYDLACLTQKFWNKFRNRNEFQFK